MRRGFVFLLALIYAGFHLYAQVNATGTLLGTVTDKTGGVVPGASVNASNKSTSAAMR